MVNPVRKKPRKQQRPELCLVKAAPQPSDPLRITTAHSVRPGVLDLNEFADGTLNKISADTRWRGGFKGRPKLAAELAQHFCAIHATASRNTISTLVTALRAWWRFFDRVEELAPVREVEHLSEIHMALAAREGMPRAYLMTVVSAFNAVRALRQLPELHIYAPKDAPKPESLPERKAIAAIYQELKTRFRKCFSRFEEADSLAAKGVVLVPQQVSTEPLSAAIVHATYRAHVDACGNPVPLSAPGLNLHCRDGTSQLQRRALPVAGLYPTKEDVQAGLLLFLLKTGWNAQVGLDLDITGPWIRPHPNSPQHHLVVGTKSRGDTEQIAIGLEKSETSPGRIVQAFIDRTRPLRLLLQTRLAAAEKSLLLNPSGDQHIEVVELRRMMQSPWIYVDPGRRNAIYALDTHTYGMTHRKPVLRTWIRERNEHEQERTKSTGQTAFLVPETIAISDFRDAFIAFSYETSGFNWLVTKLAAGHTSIESLKTYLRKRRWKAFGEQQVSGVLEALWSEIRTRKVVDVAILRGLVERGEVTEQQRQRWAAHKDRTRIGTGCLDFHNPPLEISPEHATGCGCRVQRCTLCSHAIVFPDSVSHLARRMAELEFLQTQVPLKTWFESTFPDEVEATSATLGLFKPDEVEAATHFWRSEIRQGHHRVLQFEGSYA